MGYSIRTDRYRYTEWLAWNGSALAPARPLRARTPHYRTTEDVAELHRLHPGLSSFQKIAKAAAWLRQHRVPTGYHHNGIYAPPLLAEFHCSGQAGNDQGNPRRGHPPNGCG